MDNFKRTNKSTRDHARTVDGFTKSSGREYQGSLSGQSRSAMRRSSNHLDNFKRPDGFRPSSSGSLNNSNNNIGSRLSRRDDGPIELNLPPAKSKKRGSPRRGRMLARKSLVMLFLVGILGTGYLFGKTYLKALQIFKGGGGAAALHENVDPSRLRGEGDGRINIMMLGRGGPGHEGADLTDTILVASIDPINNDAALLSIPRDLYVQTTNFGSMKINSVYATAKNQVLAGSTVADQKKKAEEAGIEALETTLEQSIGIPMHYHVIIDFNGFKKAIDTVGGVDIKVTKSVYDYMHINGRPYILDVKEGQQHFDGLRALMYARSRKTSARGDFDRSERQRQILVALKTKIFSLGTYSNPLKINQLTNDFGNHVSTNLLPGEILRLYEIGNNIDASKVSSVGLADPPHNFVTTDNVNGLSVVVPRAGFNNFKDIQNFVRNALKDGFLKNEDATVSVLNGTSVAGLAARTAEQLKSYGYNISQIANSPLKNLQATVIVDLSGGKKKYTKAYLEKRFGVQTVSGLPDSRINPGTADFVIILGQNEQTRLQN